MRRILETQILLLSVLGDKSGYTIGDFGYPVGNNGEQAVYASDLPSIKRTQKSIKATSPKDKGTMHDIPGKKQFY